MSKSTQQILDSWKAIKKNVDQFVKSKSVDDLAKTSHQAS
jgi:hypothetical protein